MEADKKQTQEELKVYSVNELCDSFLNYAIRFFPTFQVTDTNKDVIRTLCLYFYEHPENELPLDKGIYLCGTVGTGKTTIMKLFSNWPLNKNKFRFISCREIQQEFAIGGFQSLLKYTKQSYMKRQNMIDKSSGAITYCFDDFGAEGRSKFYGNDVNVMEEILQDRYREYQDYKMRTHMTSNITGGEVMEENYGERVRDRSREMFNKINMNGPSFRK